MSLLPSLEFIAMHAANQPAAKAARAQAAAAFALNDQRHKAIADAQKQVHNAELYHAKLESESKCLIGLVEFTGLPTESIQAVILYLDPRQGTLCSADTKLLALQTINKYGSMNSIRYEDALIVLETQIKKLQQQYSISRPEITSIIEAKKKEAGILAGSIFDKKAAAEKAEKDAKDAELRAKTQREAEEKCKIEAEANKLRVLEGLKAKNKKHNFTECGAAYAIWSFNPSPFDAVISLGILIPSFTPITHYASPMCFIIPETWNTDFEKGLIPFLPSCPFCKKQTIANGTPNGNITYVSCHDHYKWDPVTNKHYKYIINPPRPATGGPYLTYYPEGRYVVWDPADPDGTLAKKAATEKEIAEIEKAITELQSKLLTLKSL